LINRITDSDALAEQLHAGEAKMIRKDLDGSFAGRRAVFG